MRSRFLRCLILRLTMEEIARRVESKWPTHAERRTRQRQQLTAATSRVRHLSAVLYAVGRPDDMPASEVHTELAKRLTVVAPCLEAQIHAAAAGSLNTHTSRHLVPHDDHIMSNAHLQVAMAMRLRALAPPSADLGPCQHKSTEMGERCLKPLDCRGHHARTCRIGGGVVRRHDRIRDWLASWIMEITGRTALTEQFVPGGQVGRLLCRRTSETGVCGRCGR